MSETSAIYWLQRELAEARAIIAACGAEKDELRAKALAAEHRCRAAEYRAQRIVLDAELLAKVARLEQVLRERGIEVGG